jgi:hypothetical protein
MRGRARGEEIYTPPRETLAATSSRPNSEALPACVVLEQPRAAFHPCTCGLYGGATAVASTLIGYDEVEVAARTTIWRRQSWTTTSSTPMCDYVGLLLQLFFYCLARLVVTIHDLLVACILGWHDRSSASIAYLFFYSGIRSILHNSWSGSYTMVICDGY